MEQILVSSQHEMALQAEQFLEIIYTVDMQKL